eukprot:TRINITY_DN38363_c0_g1_i1.p1 TRINITY_DN38363_c0_g1~~TRINITY_DN38363_c0_g1_i1.p1  ORF type:complete len:400 (+),score=51.17 TRINITY_DN38363_c0_g1_i1:161-1360(+)
MGCGASADKGATAEAIKQVPDEKAAQTESVSNTGIDSIGTLIGAKPECFEDAHVSMCDGATEPNFESLSALLASQPENEELKRQTENIVKKCASCGKANAKTLEHCNSCGASLPSELTTSPNVCVAFIYGVAPLKVSIRYQSEEILVYDDLMQCSPCHFNAISTTQYIQNWLCLLKRPADALVLIDQLYAAAEEALQTQFWANTAWKDRFLHPASRQLPFDDFRKLVCAGFNYPPSQFQLHLQFMLPVFVPQQWQMLAAGKSFVYGRFFPVSYVRDALTKAAVAGNNIAGIDADFAIDDVIRHFDALGVVYKDYHEQTLADAQSAHRRLAHWQPSHFSKRLVGDSIIEADSKAEVEGDFRKLFAQDQLVLQNYGRPFVDGKPSGSYYKHAKRTASLATW